MFFLSNYFYYISIGLQAVCVFHCIRKGNQNNWIWIIVFLPFIGCLAYFFTEIWTRSEMRSVQSGLSSLFHPAGNIKKLEENLRFSDTVKNKVTLADAYLAAGITDKAIALYEACLHGAFAENEHILTQLIIAYAEKKRFAEMVSLARRVDQLPQFHRSRAHLLYAMALEQTGKTEEAEKEFQTMNGRFSCFEARYQYGLFLKRNGREEEGTQVLRQLVDEVPHLSAWERKSNRAWFAKARQELKKPVVA